EGWELLGDDAFVRRTIERLHALGIRAILYVRAYVSENSLATDPPGLVGEVARRGLAAKTRDGDPYFFTANESPALLYDFTNPATVRFWQQRRLKRMLDLGADGFMQDFGEHTFDAMRFADGSTGEQMHNRFPVLYHRLSRAYVDRYAREHRGGQPVWFFTRAGYSGRPGSAASEMGNFPGDETTNWEGASGLRSLAPDMLNRAVGGSFGYTTDIGGYADLLSGATTPELFTRWSEWSALTPYFRVHNSVTFGTRMPWDFGEETYDRWRAMADLHQRALPLIRRLWAEGRRTGVPPTRPLWLAAPGDRRAAAEDQEWLLGDDVLVAPVVEEGAAGREVTFPRGCWASPQGGERVRGPAVRRIEAPPGRLPYFMRCGARPF
ncbi:MAG TPA: TIM-barrel domain-containing protein, partial [Solirubrobacteraceae bacterium]|nr:TIM-barrel domain-containing protein [Solirubrobacteraceae bacterium]